MDEKIYTSTPKGAKCRGRTPKAKINSDILDGQSPISGTCTNQQKEDDSKLNGETIDDSMESSKSYPKRQRKPKKWDDFETETVGTPSDRSDKLQASNSKKQANDGDTKSNIISKKNDKKKNQSVKNANENAGNLKASVSKRKPTGNTSKYAVSDSNDESTDTEKNTPRPTRQSGRSPKCKDDCKLDKDETGDKVNLKDRSIKSNPEITNEIENASDSITNCNTLNDSVGSHCSVSNKIKTKGRPHKSRTAKDNAKVDEMECSEGQSEEFESSNIESIADERIIGNPEDMKKLKDMVELKRKSRTGISHTASKGSNSKITNEIDGKSKHVLPNINRSTSKSTVSRCLRIISRTESTSVKTIPSKNSENNTYTSGLKRHSVDENSSSNSLKPDIENGEKQNKLQEAVKTPSSNKREARNNVCMSKNESGNIHVNGAKNTERQFSDEIAKTPEITSTKRASSRSNRVVKKDMDNSMSSDPVVTPRSGRKRKVVDYAALEDGKGEEKETKLKEKDLHNSSIDPVVTPRSGRKRKVVDYAALEDGNGEEKETKLKEKDLDNSMSSDAVVTPRSGRKRKVVDYAALEDGKGEEKETKLKEKDLHNSSIDPVVTPRSGRKRKVVNYTTQEDGNGEEEETKLKKKDLDNSMSSDAVVTPRSGRKRKVVNYTTQEDGNGEEEETKLKEKDLDNSMCSDAVVTPRVGRKRKDVDYVALEDGEEEETKLKTKTPKKREEDEDFDAEDTDDEPVSTKGRGSARKKKPSKKQSQSYQCTRCDHVANDVKSMQRHVAINHQVWWTKENPEGLDDKSAMSQVFKLKKFLNCTKCEKRINFIQYYHKHVEWCGRENERFVCELCERTLMLRWKREHMLVCTRNAAIREMQDEKLAENETTETDETNLGRGNKRHAATKARSLVQKLSKDLDVDPFANADNSDIDPDVDLKDEDEQEEEDEDIDLDIEEDEDNDWDDEQLDDDDLVRKDGYSRSSLSSRNCGHDFQRYGNFHANMLMFMKENCAQPLFTNWLPRKQDMKLLTASESEAYLPHTDRSVQFKFGRRGTCNDMPLYGSQSVNGFPLFYTGLSIWRLAWCPVPVDCKDNQYLAVVGKTDSQTDFNIYEQRIGPGVIQIWYTGIVNNDMKEKLPPARLCFNIAHDFGLATAIQWCPSGCYQSKENQVDDTVYPRLGLLAASFTDSSVRIFSVPHIPMSTDGVAPTYHMTAVVSLVAHKEWQNSKLTCSCIDWLQLKGHSKIMAGYSNGTICLFHLTTSSPLLYLKKSPQTYLLPYRSFQPHSNVVRAARWIGKTDNIIVTGCENFEAYFWNVENTSFPLFPDNATFGTINMAASFWHSGICAVSDDSYAVNWNKSRYFECSTLMYKFNTDEDIRKNETITHFLASQSACVWGISLSNWLNFVVMCDNRGYINAVPLSDMLKHVLDSKTYKHRQLMLKTFIIKKKDTESENTSAHTLTQCSCGDNQSDNCEKCKINQSGNVSQNDTCNTGQSPDTVQNNCDTTDQSETTIAQISCHSKTSNQSNDMLKNADSGTSNRDDSETVKWDMPKRVAETYPRKQRAYIKSPQKETSSNQVPGKILLEYQEHFKIEFNPNHLQCCWMAFGGDAGLVRLVNIQNLLPFGAQLAIKASL